MQQSNRRRKTRVLPRKIKIPATPPLDIEIATASNPTPAPTIPNPTTDMEPNTTSQGSSSGAHPSARPTGPGVATSKGAVDINAGPGSTGDALPSSQSGLKKKGSDKPTKAHTTPSGQPSNKRLPRKRDHTRVTGEPDPSATLSRSSSSSTVIPLKKSPPTNVAAFKEPSKANDPPAEGSCNVSPSIPRQSGSGASLPDNHSNTSGIPSYDQSNTLTPSDYSALYKILARANIKSNAIRYKPKHGPSRPAIPLQQLLTKIDNEASTPTGQQNLHSLLKLLPEQYPTYTSADFLNFPSIETETLLSRDSYAGLGSIEKELKDMNTHTNDKIVAGEWPLVVAPTKGVSWWVEKGGIVFLVAVGREGAGKEEGTETESDTSEYKPKYPVYEPFPNAENGEEGTSTTADEGSSSKDDTAASPSFHTSTSPNNNPGVSAPGELTSTSPNYPTLSAPGAYTSTPTSPTSPNNNPAASAPGAYTPTPTSPTFNTPTSGSFYTPTSEAAPEDTPEATPQETPEQTPEGTPTHPKYPSLPLSSTTSSIPPPSQLTPYFILHTSLLSTTSPSLYASLLHQPSGTIIPLPCTPRALNALIEWIYTSHLMTTLTIDVLLEVGCMAHLLGIDKLVTVVIREMDQKVEGMREGEVIELEAGMVRMVYRYSGAGEGLRGLLDRLIGD